MNRADHPYRAKLAAVLFALCLPVLLIGALGATPSTSYAADKSYRGFFDSSEFPFSGIEVPSFELSDDADDLYDTQESGGAFGFGYSYGIVYKMNGGCWLKIPSYDIDIRENIWRNETIQVKDLAKPVRFGYTFKGWYTNKALTKKAKTIKGTESASSRTLYAKWAKAKNPYGFVKTSGKVAQSEVNKVVKTLKKNKKLAKEFYLQGGTITIYSSAKYAKLFGSLSVGNTESRTYGSPRVSLKASTGTSADVVLHELGHWYFFYQVSETKQSKIEQAYPKYVNKIGNVLGSYAASSFSEAYADTFSAIKCKTLSSAQKKQLGKWYTLVKSTIKITG